MCTRHRRRIRADRKRLITSIKAFRKKKFWYACMDCGQMDYVYLHYPGEQYHPCVCESCLLKVIGGLDE